VALNTIKQKKQNPLSTALIYNSSQKSAHGNQITSNEGQNAFKAMLL
jgi:hypothetical protein